MSIDMNTVLISNSSCVLECDLPTLRMPHMDQDLLTIQEQLRSTWSVVGFVVLCLQVSLLCFVQYWFIAFFLSFFFLVFAYHICQDLYCTPKSRCLNKRLIHDAGIKMSYKTKYGTKQKSVEGQHFYSIYKYSQGNILLGRKALVF